MKRVTAIVLVTLLWAAATSAAGERYRLEVDGLACPFCAYGIEKRLSRIPGIEAITTDIKSGTVNITMREGARLEREQAARAVEKAGFTLRGFSRQPAQ